jgi:hypothetical protein
LIIGLGPLSALLAVVLVSAMVTFVLAMHAALVGYMYKAMVYGTDDAEGSVFAIAVSST